jgi:D-3-phosphoglycerate dehydrogenase / 2-oxoglutarate reductase
VTPLRVLISTSSFGVADASPLERLEHEGVEVSLNPHGRVLTEEEIAELIAEVDGLIAGTEPLSERVLAQAPRLRVISRVGVGIERIDLDAAERRGVQVFITPDALTDAVAEMTLAGMLTLLRGLHTMNAALHAGRWEKTMGSLLRGKTVGIVGLGRIGQAVALLLAPFGVRRIACDAEPDHDWAAANGVEFMSLRDLLPQAQIASVHASGRECLIDAEELSLLPEGALVLNVARGGLVDEAALHAALSSGRLAGCYVDTFEREPYDGPLRELPNALLTPHVGSYAREARVRMEREAVENLLLGLGSDGR